MPEITEDEERSDAQRSIEEHARRLETIELQLVELTRLRRRTRRLTLASFLSLVLALSAGGAAGFAWYELEDFRTATDSELRFQQSDIDSVDGRVGDLESDVGQNVGFESVSDRVDALERELATSTYSLYNRVDDLENDIGFSFGFGDLSTRVDALESTLGGWGGIENQLEEMRDCVNEYMDVVADAGGGGYYYYNC